MPKDLKAVLYKCLFPDFDHCTILVKVNALIHR